MSSNCRKWVRMRCFILSAIFLLPSSVAAAQGFLCSGDITPACGRIIGSHLANNTFFGAYLADGRTLSRLIGINGNNNIHIDPDGNSTFVGLGGAHTGYPGLVIPGQAGIWFTSHDLGQDLNVINTDGSDNVYIGNANRAGSSEEGSMIFQVQTGREFFWTVNGATVASLNSAALTMSKPFRNQAVPYAALPVCNTSNEAMTSGVVDSTTDIFGAPIQGHGGYHVLAYCDGTAWTVAAE